VKKIRQLVLASRKWEYTALCLLLLIITVLHFSTILQPSSLVFDEQYYIPAAKSILQGEGTDRTEHPPLGQLILTSGVWLFGDNPVGWRFFPIVFGVIGLVFFYLICRQLNIAPRLAFLATFLLSFENLGFVMSSVAMLDVFSLTFMLASFWFFLKGSYTGSGIMVGLATLSKLTGILALLIILAYWIFTAVKNQPSISSLFKGETKREFPIVSLKSPLLVIFFTLLTFWALMPLLEFIIWHKWLNPASQVGFMIKANTLATFASSPSDMLSRPWDWLILPKILTFWITPHYIAMISPTLWVFIIPVTVFLIYKTWKNHRTALFTLIWFTATYLIWIPVSLITDRMSYIYYFYPAAGAVCIGLSLIASKIEDATNNQPDLKIKRWLKLIVPSYLLLYLGAFVILSPVSYWWKLPLCVAAYLLSRYYLSGEKQIDRDIKRVSEAGN
jgi:dolichyl-phosphate-mannose-protein mannosyltransferase